MELVIATEYLFERCADGMIYSPDGRFSEKFWKNHLAIFDKIIVLARVFETERKDCAEKFLAQLDNVSFVELPNCSGLDEFFGCYARVRNTLKSCISANRAYLCSVPSMIGSMLALELRRQNIPYGITLGSDGWDTFGKTDYAQTLRRLVRSFSFVKLYETVSSAAAVIYPTPKSLQKRYRPSKDAYSIFLPDTGVNDQEIAPAPKHFKQKKEINLVSSCMTADMYKPSEVILQAVRILNDRGISCHLTCVGEEKFRKNILDHAEHENVGRCISFMDIETANDRIQEGFNKADLFVHMTESEGASKCLLRAMSAGLPCIGSHTIDIGSVLDRKAIIESIDADKLADKIEQFVTNSTVMNNQAKRNLVKAGNFLDSKIHNDRQEFLIRLRSISGQMA